MYLTASRLQCPYIECRETHTFNEASDLLDYNKSFSGQSNDLFGDKGSWEEDEWDEGSGKRSLKTIGRIICLVSRKALTFGLDRPVCNYNNSLLPKRAAYGRKGHPARVGSVWLEAGLSSALLTRFIYGLTNPIIR